LLGPFCDNEGPFCDNSPSCSDAMDDVELALRKAIALQITDSDGLGGIPADESVGVAALASRGDAPPCT
jgi:hypothetical protein